MQIYKLYLNVQKIFVAHETMKPQSNFTSSAKSETSKIREKVKLVKFGRGELDLLGGNKKAPGFPGANEQNQQYLF